MFNLNIRKRSPLARFYQLWVDLGGERPEMNNLCHFTRVILFWAPLRWFFYRTWGSAWIQPWSVVLGGTFVVLLALAGEVQTYFQMIITTFAWVLMYLVVAAFLIAVLVSGLFQVVPVIWKFIDERLRSGKIFGAISTTFGNVLMFDVFGIKFWIIIPLGIALAIGIWEPDVILILLAVALGYFSFFAIMEAFSELGKGPTEEESIPNPIVETVRDSYSLGKAYVVAQKKKICPSITFVD